MLFPTRNLYFVYFVLFKQRNNQAYYSKDYYDSDDERQTPAPTTTAPITTTAHLKLLIIIHIDTSFREFLERTDFCLNYTHSDTKLLFTYLPLNVLSKPLDKMTQTELDSCFQSVLSNILENILSCKRHVDLDVSNYLRGIP